MDKSKSVLVVLDTGKDEGSRVLAKVDSVEHAAHLVENYKSENFLNSIEGHAKGAMDPRHPNPEKAAELRQFAADLKYGNLLII